MKYDFQYLKDAYETMKTALLFNPPESRVWMEAGNLSLELHVYEEAIEYLKKAITLDPTNMEAIISYSSVLTNLKLYKESLEI